MYMYIYFSVRGILRNVLVRNPLSARVQVARVVSGDLPLSRNSSNFTGGVGPSPVISPGGCVRTMEGGRQRVQTRCGAEAVFQTLPIQTAWHFPVACYTIVREAYIFFVLSRCFVHVCFGPAFRSGSRSSSAWRSSAPRARSA